MADLVTGKRIKRATTAGKSDISEPSAVTRKTQGDLEGLILDITDSRECGIPLCMSIL